MRKVILLVISCLLLIGLILPSCTSRSGGEPLSLEPGSTISGVDGVTIGAPEGALNETIEVFIEKVDDPRAEVPFPEYLAHVDVVGNFYGISAGWNFSASDENCLLLGLPVPTGIPTDDLAVLVLVPPDSVFTDEPDNPASLRWITLSGTYDAQSGLFGIQLPSLTDVMISLALIEVGVDWTEGNLFKVGSIGFNDTESPESHREMTLEALNSAYAAYVTRMGFREPDLRHPVKLISWFPPIITLDENHYEYLLTKGAAYGEYDPYTRVAFTRYPGVPDEPDLIGANHELFHAIQFAYPALRDNLDDFWALRRPMEAAATAAELSLDGLTRSNHTVFSGREPHPVTWGLWSSDTIDTTDYAAQDFLVYLGKQIAPVDPQLNFMIPWFQQGGLIVDLDAALHAGSTFNSLGDAYWQWAKNQAFEKQVILGLDDADHNYETVPHGESCSWSEHGYTISTYFSPDTWTWGVNTTNFKVEPLSSRVYELILNPGDTTYAVTSTVNSTDPDVEFKFYETGDTGSEGCWDEARDNAPHTFCVGEEPVTGYLLVSNTNAEIISDSISLIALDTEPISLYEDFEDDQDQGWTHSGGGSISIEDDAGNKVYDLQGAEDGTPAFTFYDAAAEWSDYEVEFDIKLNELDCDSHFYFRFSDWQNYYCLAIRTGNGDWWGGGKFQFYQTIDGEYVFDMDGPFNSWIGAPVEVGTWYHIKISAIGDRIQLYFNDELKFDRTGALLSTGEIGFAARPWPVASPSSFGHINIDNIVVTGACTPS